MRELISSILTHARRVMIYGSDSDRVAFMRSALPALTRALAEKEEAEQVVRMRESYEQMQQWIKDAPAGDVHVRLARIQRDLPPNRAMVPGGVQDPVQEAPVSA